MPRQALQSGSERQGEAGTSVANVAPAIGEITLPIDPLPMNGTAGNLNFHSDSYQWLVVGGPKATFKGAGAINGEGEYGFMLSAIDGQITGGGGIDKFRIKIWDVATEAVVYDNLMDSAEDAAPTTVLGGGSIVIHTK